MVQENFPWCWPILATWPYAVRFFFVFFIKTLPGKCIASRDEKLVRLKYSPLLDLYKFSVVIISYRRDRSRYAIAAFTLIATRPTQYRFNARHFPNRKTLFASRYFLHLDVSRLISSAQSLPQYSTG